MAYTKYNPEEYEKSDSGVIRFATTTPSGGDGALEGKMIIAPATVLNGAANGGSDGEFVMLLPARSSVVLMGGCW